MADGSHQILHVDKMCNECGNCTQFCPYHSEPCHDKFTLFQTAEDMADSHNAGVLFLSGDRVKVRTFGDPRSTTSPAATTCLRSWKSSSSPSVTGTPTCLRKSYSLA